MGGNRTQGSMGSLVVAWRWICFGQMYRGKCVHAMVASSRSYLQEIFVDHLIISASGHVIYSGIINNSINCSNNNKYFEKVLSKFSGFEKM